MLRLVNTRVVTRHLDARALINGLGRYHELAHCHPQPVLFRQAFVLGRRLFSGQWILDVYLPTDWRSLVASRR